MNISVLGCGRWGAFIAWYVCGLNHKVTLWGRENSKALAELKETRKNQFLTLQDEMNLTSSLDEAISFGEYIVISISAQQLRALAKQINEYNVEGKTFILCMKGIESTTGKRLTQVFREEVGYKCNLAIWVGPGHVQDFVAGIPNCMVIGSDNIEVTKKIADELSSDLIRFYYGQDLIGNEIGAAAKNVIGIAAGMLDGVGYGSLKGALMARGAREVSKLVRAMGGNELTAYGLSHLGDYEATLFSSHSNNRQFGEDFVKKNKFSKLAEGVSTAKALQLLSKTYNVDLPICNAINSIIGEEQEPKEILGNLFGRTRKFEF
ncbi:NAD(P)H-dependent glycerol-3-phosphate dehydrogenase [Clostridium cellulovorans]|uniref:Glycerol-3-phosphate dehydrogenase n=1 Tax=Clostridium cellulovorans (strain ATCC 35296 / DSM 3052 / OCM 3 / 743B) TaxID=573061 RepID=D9SUD8_CLOC7|nr:NAD(P)H-dependent glycerol-3-phosphate dehydrogenase [Clostridium cellulovorans]ADL52893.1 NAD-dependent glycerol-3-phosphate dehydrogenase domain protein [Clostridium cellulovorans 743B]